MQLLSRLPALLGTGQRARTRLHGDLHGGNVRCAGNGEPVVVDPWIFYGDRELELVSTLVSDDLLSAFYDAYQATWPLEPDADRFGALDVLVNDAVILYDTWQQARSANLAVVHQALDSNLIGAWSVATVFMPLLRRSIHGRIVNVSSKAGSLVGMGGGIPAIASRRRHSTPLPVYSPTSCGTTMWSTASAPVGWLPIWTGRVVNR